MPFMDTVNLAGIANCHCAWEKQLLHNYWDTVLLHSYTFYRPPIYTQGGGVNTASFIRKMLVLKSYQVVTVKKKKERKKQPKHNPPPSSYMVTMFDTGGGAREQVQPCKVPSAWASGGTCCRAAAGWAQGCAPPPRGSRTRFPTQASHRSPVLHPQTPGQEKDQAFASHRRHRVKSMKVSRAGATVSSPAHAAMVMEETNFYRN